MTILSSNKSHAMVSFLSVLLLTLLIAVSAHGCDQSACRRPIHLYKVLGCTPVYRNPGDCCAYKYDCPLRNREKCYVNGHEYSHGENIQNGDMEPCTACICEHDAMGKGEVSSCASSSCGYPPRIPKGCILVRRADNCCTPDVICPKNGERSTCFVGDKVYNFGEIFHPSSEPEKVCFCHPGYNGTNVLPFCYTDLDDCGFDMHKNHATGKCPPLYKPNRNIQTDCPDFDECLDGTDLIPNSTSGIVENEANCKFGNKKLSIGEVFHKSLPEANIDCVCEVPPLANCVYKEIQHPID